MDYFLVTIAKKLWSFIQSWVLMAHLNWKKLHQCRNVEESDDVKLKSIRSLPGPLGYPIIGTLLDYFRAENYGKVHELHQRRHRQYGKIIKERLGPQLNVNVADAEIVGELAKQEGRTPFRPPYQAWTEYNEMTGHQAGLITAQGERWGHLRKSLSKYLMPQRCVTNSMSSVHKVVTDFIDRLRRKATPHDFLPDLCNELYLFSLESTVTVLLDTRLGCLENQLNKRAQDFIAAIGDMFDTGFKMVVGANVHRWLGTSCWRTHCKAWDSLLAISRSLIEERLEEMDEMKRADPNGLADRFLEMGVLGKLLSDARMSLDDICANTSELMGGGIDTTANCLAYTLYLLATHPEVQKRLHGDIYQVTQGGECRLEHLQDLPYMKNVLKESLRLFPVIPIDARIMQRDTNLSGYRIPKGTCVLINIYTMSRSAEYYERPDDFDPGRWDGADLGEKSRSDCLKSMPFGFGGRSCIGKRIAEAEIGMAVCSIVQNFKLKPHDSLELNTTVRTVMTPGKKLNIIFEERNAIE